MEIRVDDLSGPEIRGLIEEHLRSMFLHSPPESVHALPLDALRRPEMPASASSRAGRLRTILRIRTACS